MPQTANNYAQSKNSESRDNMRAKKSATVKPLSKNGEAQIYKVPNVALLLNNEIEHWLVCIRSTKIRITVLPLFCSCSWPYWWLHLVFWCAEALATNESFLQHVPEYCAWWWKMKDTWPSNGDCPIPDLQFSGRERTSLEILGESCARHSGSSCYVQGVFPVWGMVKP